MRNLKKILALVLALVMSLSLMATASAADTTAGSDAATLYKLAGNVLVGLDVVKGDKEDPTNYRLNDNIIRAEAAALIYRVHTADVNDVKADLHDYTPFSDLASVQDWATGYISYAHNAGIVKGKTATTFDPLASITGYETLAMTLRAMGYGKNGEFEGDEWRQNTASWAQRIGLLKGVAAADQTQTRMDQPATRGLVFQIMFNAMLLDEVQFSALNPYNYESLGTTLGQRNFGLEEITGVVRANEWANLDGSSVLDAGVTKMTVSEVNPSNSSSVAKVGQSITLDASTDLNAVGLRHVAYMAGTGTSKTVITELSSEGLNKVADNEGAGVNTGLRNEGYESIQKLADTQGISLTDADYYINYAEANQILIGYTSDWVIRYAVDKAQADATWGADYFTAKGATTRNITLNTIKADGTTEKTVVPCYVVTIEPKETILIDGTDWTIMQEIFYTADRVGDNTVDATGALRDYVVGEVYAGTSSLKDRSDEMSWEQFIDQFLTNEVYADWYNWCRKGDSLRVVDNGVDPTLVLRVDYVQTKAVDTYKDELAFNGNTTEKLNVLLRNYPGLKMADYEGNNLYNPDGLSKSDMGVIVNYTIIDGKLTIKKAPVLTEIIKSKSYKDWTVTTEETDSVLGQSGILNCTRLPENNQLMEEKVLYNIYLDEFENVRSYELANGPQYALLTEMYPANSQNWTYVQDARQIVELKIQDNDITEKYVVKGSHNPFFSNYAWTSRFEGYNVYTTLPNYLQPATAHLDVNASIYMPNSWSGDVFGLFYDDGMTYPTPNIVSDYVSNTGYFDVEGAASSISVRYQTNDDPTDPGRTTVWNRNIYLLNPNGIINGTPVTNSALPGVFLWGDGKYYSYTDSVGATQWTIERDFSFTNVAKYVEDGEEVTLSSASKLYLDVNGQYRYRAATNTITVDGGANYATQYVNWTATQWESWYNQYNTTAGRTFANWFQTQINSGAIYNIYEYDYVQLSTNEEMWNSDSTHFGIAPEYAGKYNALSNQYVNTIDSTEFYVVTPSGAYYAKGFNDFNAMFRDYGWFENVRAAYAVAQNTAVDANGQDYWVADVVVIEVDDLGGYWDSIALMYYNPYETSNNTQFVDGLDNAWRYYQPNYENKAMMEIVPKNYSAWQNASWGNSSYGFYFLYDTDLVSEGNYEAGDAVKMTGNYNYYGIYAGIAYRENKLIDGGNYIDVRMPGLNTVGGDYSTRVYVRHTDSNGATWSTPIYRLERDQFGRTTAKELSLTEWDVTNSAETGDRVIVVYDGGYYQNYNAAYIIVLGDTTTGVRSNGWYNPSWLVGLYNAIITEQTHTDPAKQTAAQVLTAGDALVAAATGATRVITFEEVKALLDRVNEILENKEYTDLDQGNNLETLQHNLEDLLNSAQTDLATAIKNQNAKLAVYEELAKYAEDLANLYTGDVKAAVETALESALADAKTAILEAADAEAAEALLSTKKDALITAATDAASTYETEHQITSASNVQFTFEETVSGGEYDGDSKYTGTFPQGFKAASNPIYTDIEVAEGLTPVWTGTPDTKIANVAFTKAATRSATATWTMAVTLTDTYYVAVQLNSDALTEALDVEDIILVAGAPEATDEVTVVVSTNLTTEEGEPVVTTNLPDTLKVGDNLPTSVVVTAVDAKYALSSTASDYAIQGVGTGVATAASVVLSENDTKATLTFAQFQTINASTITVGVQGVTEKAAATITGTDITADPATTYVGDTLTEITVTSDDSTKVVTAISSITNDGGAVDSKDYTLTNGKITFTSGLVVAGDIEITATLTTSHTVTVTTTADDHFTATPVELTVAEGSVTELPITITAASGYAIKSVTLKVGSSGGDVACTVVPAAGQTAGKITFSSTSIDDDATITVVTEEVFAVAEVTGFTSDVDEVTETQAASSVAITLTGKTGTEVAADDEVTVTVGSGSDATTLTKDTDYSVSITAGDGTAGKIVVTINSGKITGPVTITVTAA